VAREKFKGGHPNQLESEVVFAPL